MLKAPTPGYVKTRLARAIGIEAACLAYKELVEHQLKAVPAHWRIEVHGTPESELQMLQAWLGDLRETTFYPQKEGDLGERMTGAVEGALARGAGCVVLLGGDCAELDSDRLRALEESLMSAPVSIIPATDGGYVALGMSRLLPCLFHQMPWSQSTLMQETRAALARSQVRWTEGRACRDVDDLADWEAALPLLANQVATASKPNSSGLNHDG
jgi:hypothetical protein